MAGKMTKCKTCGADVAKSAKTCPNCGAKQKHTGPVRIIIGIVVILIGITALSQGLNGGSSGDKLTKAMFDSVQTGMTYDQVVDITGFDGELGSQVDIGAGSQYKTEIYTWSNADGSNMNATFQGDKLVTKAQVGLK